MSGFPTTERIKGRQVFPTCKGAKTQWDSIDFNAMFAVENPQSAQAIFKEKILDISDATATITGFFGNSNNTSNLPQIGDLISDLSFKVETVEQIPAELLAALTAGKWRVVKTNYKFGKDSAKWSFDIEAGFIDTRDGDTA